MNSFDSPHSCCHTVYRQLSERTHYERELEYSHTLKTLSPRSLAFADRQPLLQGKGNIVLKPQLFAIPQLPAQPVRVLPENLGEGTRDKETPTNHLPLFYLFFPPSSTKLAFFKKFFQISRRSFGNESKVKESGKACPVRLVLDHAAFDFQEFTPFRGCCETFCIVYVFIGTTSCATHAS